MSVERIFGCDAPECAAHIRTQAEQPPTFITVTENPGHPRESGAEMHFCSWDCVLKRAAMVEPSERIEFDGDCP